MIGTAHLVAEINFLKLTTRPSTLEVPLDLGQIVQSPRETCIRLSQIHTRLYASRPRIAVYAT
jgi:hypothetical protein